jgi:hypothetical protein
MMKTCNKCKFLGIDDEDETKPKVQVLFDSAFPHGIASWGCKEKRCFCLCSTDLLNLSHGRRRLVNEAPEAPSTNAWSQREAMRSAFAAVKKTKPPQPPGANSLPLPNDSDARVREFFQVRFWV